MLITTNSNVIYLRDTRQVTYDIGIPSAGDEFVVVALEEATIEVDKAIKSTVDNLFSGSPKSITNSTPAELLRLFRYPPENQRGLARSAEIYERTLELVAEKVREKESLSESANNDNFSYEDLISPTNLQLIANTSGCEAHRAAREINCTQDMCFHSKYRAVDGTCNNFMRYSSISKSLFQSS